MSDAMGFEYAIQEPALAIAPVFLALRKGSRPKLDVWRSFGNSTLNWRGTDALGIPEQSVLLGLLSIAGQQAYRLNPQQPQKTGKLLLAQLALGGQATTSDLAVIKASWVKIIAAAGYKSAGGNNIKIVRMAVKRLAETTIWEKCPAGEFQSRLLAWIAGDNDGVTIVLNRRATSSLYGGHYVKISLLERNSLPDEPSKALHAWLSGHMRSGSTMRYKLSNFQAHIWAGEATGSTLRSRLAKVRQALTLIAMLPNWNCVISSDGQVEIKRIDQWTIDDKKGDFPRAKRTIADATKVGNKTG